MTAVLHAQQSPVTTLFDWNRINYNPAYSGVSQTTNIAVLTRQQWVGFTDAPRNQYISTNAFLTQDVGIGGVIFNNVAGPTRQTGLKAAFAKHVRLNKTTMLSLALSLDLFQNFYDDKKLLTALPDDPAIVENRTEQTLSPDASVGAVIYSGNYHIGLSCSNLTQSKYDFFSTQNSFKNPINRSYYLSGSYAHVFNDNTRYSPSLLMKKTMGMPLQIDFLNKLYFKPAIVGLAYRSNNELSLLLGVRFANFYELAYAFDYSLNALGEYSKGSHEIVLHFRLVNPNRNEMGRKNKEQFLWD